MHTNAARGSAGLKSWEPRSARGVDLFCDAINVAIDVLDAALARCLIAQLQQKQDTWPSRRQNTHGLASASHAHSFSMYVRERASEAHEWRRVVKIFISGDRGIDPQPLRFSHLWRCCPVWKCGCNFHKEKRNSKFTPGRGLQFLFANSARRRQLENWMRNILSWIYRSCVCGAHKLRWKSKTYLTKILW
jgi:hypothetical protein